MICTVSKASPVNMVNLCIPAVNDACLVFDGRLVIDASFHTNDVSIRGAGPVTKFQRSYHAEQWTHGNFNSKEVGIQVSILTYRSIYKPQWTNYKDFVSSSRVINAAVDDSTQL